MSDYTSTFTEGTGDTIDATDFSTEFNAIETAIATKYDSADLLDEDNMSSDSDTKFPSQQSVKAYVDTQIAANLELVQDTVVSASGASVAFTGIPAGTKRINIVLDDVSLSAADNVIVQIGDSGGLETSGYTSVCGQVTGGGTATAFLETTGFYLFAPNAGSDTCSGLVTLALVDAADTWAISGNIGVEGGTEEVFMTSGSYSLSATLDRLSLITKGAATFDAGQVNILYES